MVPARPASTQATNRSASRDSVACGSRTTPASLNPASTASARTRARSRRDLESPPAPDSSKKVELSGPIFVFIFIVFDCGRKDRIRTGAPAANRLAALPHLACFHGLGTPGEFGQSNANQVGGDQSKQQLSPSGSHL